MGCVTAPTSLQLPAGTRLRTGSGYSDTTQVLSDNKVLTHPDFTGSSSSHHWSIVSTQTLKHPVRITF